jgi:hypothetical protein
MANRTELGLSGGERVTVEGSLEEVEKALSDAARSGPSRLAWFAEPDGRRIGVNPAQLASLRDADAGK